MAARSEYVLGGHGGWFQVGNGALAGIAGVSASFPLDLIKTKFQLNKAEFKVSFYPVKNIPTLTKRVNSSMQPEPFTQSEV